MNKTTHNERPVILADKTGQDYAVKNATEHKKQFGQYLTPVSVADFMGSLISKREQETLTIIDPGIGAGILACAVCENAVSKITGLNKINITGYEVDNGIIEYTERSLKNLKEWLNKQNIDCSYQIIREDFILNNSACIENENLLFNSDIHKADIIISNPPYFKINKNDPRAIAASKVVYGQPNIYSLFMAVSAYLLNEDGEIIFITPRSYTSGFYFKSFREVFFSEIVPNEFHLFGSRKEAFVRDDVLQEHLIIHGKKKRKTNFKKTETVTISHSSSSFDLNKRFKRKALLHDVVNLNSENRYIFLPLSDEEENIISFVNNWKGSLHKLNMEISTGRVVPFRAGSSIKSEPDDIKNTAPLIWMNHIKSGRIEWPLDAFRKEQYISADDYTLPVLIPNNNYILMRRFSPKEELKRINTAPLFKSQLNCEYLGIENHVNYIHRPNGRLSEEEIAGLSAVLNSKYIDIYFRTLNGNTEVSATEIRDIPLPEHELICMIGRQILKSGAENLNIEKIIETKKIGAA